MSGGLFGIISAISFAFGSIATRRAVIKVLDATIGVLITVPVSVPFFLIILFATGDIGRLFSFSWQGYIWLSAAGILHFVVGRSLNYNCIQLVGSNITNIIRRVSPLVSVIFGITLLSEPLSLRLAVGVLLIVGGVSITGLNPQIFRRGHGSSSPTGIPGKAFLFGMGTGLAWGITPIMIKVGLGSSGSPVVGVFISYSAATIILSFYMWNGNKRAALLGMNAKPFGYFCLVGFFSSIAQLARYIGLSMAPASVVAPLVSTSPVFIIILSFLFNRKLEVFSRSVIFGAIAVVVGGILLV